MSSSGEGALNSTSEPLPASVIQDDEAHTLHYSQALPYASQLDREAELWLSDICTQLVVSVQAHDFAPGCLFWVKSLSSYLDLKHALPRETRANLAKLLYELTIIPGMDSALVEIWANACVRLIKKKKHLGPQDLSLPWRPLYEMIHKTFFPKSRQRTLVSESKQIASILRLAEYAQRFFPSGASQEILEEFLPKFSAHSVMDALMAQGYLVLFLPTSIPIDSITHQILDNSSVAPHDYLQTMFTLWFSITNSPTFDAQFVDLLSRIAENNVNSTFGDIGLFSKLQVSQVFGAGLRMMDLPVGSRSDGSTVGAGAGGGTTTGFNSQGLKTDVKAGNSLFLRRKHDKFKSLARFIIYTIYPGQETDDQISTMSHLKKLIQAIESYYHPSNHGRWSYQITNFARQLSSEFLKRWREEQEPDCPTLPQFRLTPELRKEFVYTIRAVVFLSLFGKDQYSVSASQSALKSLVWLEPELLFPGLLERIYPSLENLTETHRTASSLSLLSHIALPLLSRQHYPAGGKHLLPLLHLTIPGIDMNDPMKSISSLMFITTALMNVPIFDLTGSSSSGITYESEEINFESMDIDSGNQVFHVDREEDDLLCRSSTGEFEEWLSKFLNRVFTIFENLPQQDNKKMGGHMEAGLTQILLHTCEVIFNQISDELYDFGLRMIVDFAAQQVLPNAVRPMGYLCAVVTSPHPEKALKKFIPLCLDNIRTELEHGASGLATNSSTSQQPQSDSTLHWYQSILFQVLTMPGTEILKYKKDIIDILKLMQAECKSRRGFMWAGKLLRFVLMSLLEIYPLECKSVPLDRWNDPEFMANQHLYWGAFTDTANPSIKWHTPSEEEKNFALQLIDTFYTPSEKKLRELMTLNSNNSKESTNEFCRLLCVVRNCVLGSATLTDDDGFDIGNADDQLQGEEDSSTIHHMKTLHAGYSFTDSNDPRTEVARAFRRSVGNLIHDMCGYFKQSREDDVESIKMIVKIAKSYMTDRGIEKSKFDASRRGYSFAKNICKTPNCNKQYPRYLLVRRVYNHHLLRLKQNAHGRARAALHDAIFADLVELSLSYYAEIRKMAQSALTYAARCYVGSKPRIVPTLLEALQPSTEYSAEVYANRIKGALYLLNSRTLMLTCLRDWRFVPKFMLYLCKTQHEDKISVQELVRRLFVDYVFNFNSTSFRLIIPDQIQKAMDEVASMGLRSISDFEQQMQKAKAKVAERLQNETKAYGELVASLLELLKDPKVHWRFANMAANFLELLLRSDTPPSAELVEFANRCIVSELPAMRKIGISSTSRILLYIKQRTFAQGDDEMLLVKETQNPRKHLVDTPQPLPSGYTRQFLENSWTPIGSDCDLVDNMVTGWYVWPKSYEAYSLEPPNSEEIVIDQACQEGFEEFRKAYTSSDFWSKITVYMSQETSKGQEDAFSGTNARLYKSIFGMFLDEPLDAVKPEIERLCSQADQKNQQRAAAELVAGIVRGSKHWPLEKTTALWDWLGPLLRKTFAAITPDSLTYWEGMVKFCVSQRDPRRLLPLVDVILSAEFDPTSYAAFSEARKLLFVRALLTTLTWRVLPRSSDLLDAYFDNLHHPYKQVREALGGNINEILQIQWIPSIGSVKELLAFNQSDKSNAATIPISIEDPQLEEKLQKVTESLAIWRQEIEPTATAGSTKYANASKTVLCWLHEALSNWRVAGTYPHVLRLLPELFHMQDINDDHDLQTMASGVLNLIAQTSYPHSLVPHMVEAFAHILTESDSWHIRMKALPILQVFFFKHLFLLKSSEVIRIMDVITDLLMDTQIEVRQLASVTLSGLVRCSQRDAIHVLNKKYTDLVVSTRIPKRIRQSNGEKAPLPEGFQEALLKKHAGVLGLSSLVDAFPYEVPKWMPEVLVQLAGCISEPAAIQSTVRKTFSDFRRTHTDTWHEDMLQFDEDQLSLLTDMLISPSYYA
ncbi:hypothetical protein K450DRAFT_245430 [Umbelopsis ramanniana AG]|uniref:Proteasome activator subunit 4 n=1 Tax=Umbelopsis ramanniana AG TaxID=1314678 RepID=A0AAD5E9C6_UMBRA|nr:uncharacterized protein K450DRAFT_245430 [Umbelopsis ramanniana AG]KAI8578771.1 hypothetical protein K450DRAFT_245430 [Umbelopsis ramanniana AG]